MGGEEQGAEGTSPSLSVGTRQTSTTRADDGKSATPGRTRMRASEIDALLAPMVSTCRQPKAQTPSTAAVAIEARTKISP